MMNLKRLSIRAGEINFFTPEGIELIKLYLLPTVCSINSGNNSLYINDYANITFNSGQDPLNCFDGMLAAAQRNTREKFKCLFNSASR